MPLDGAEEIRLAAETWAARRVALAAEFKRKGMEEFVGVSDAQARRIIHALKTDNPEIFDALAELATIAGGIVTRRKVFADGQDVTPPR